MKHPYEVRRLLRTREFENSANFIARLTGKREMPVTVPLNPPTASAAAADTEQARQFIASWETEPMREHVEKVTRRLRGFGEQSLPERLVLSSLRDLYQFIGGDAAQAFDGVNSRLSILAKQDVQFAKAARHAATDLLAMPLDDVRTLGRLLPQLQQGMGAGRYLRALPLVDVGTKFIENNAPIIATICGQLNGEPFTRRDQFYEWLDVRRPPLDWLLLRPLCPEVRERMNGAELLRINWKSLLQLRPAWSRLLVVENEQSAFALDEVPGTAVIAGTGKNLAWLDADWLKGMPVGYWGDLDVEGLQMLAEARRRVPHLEPIMMDQATLTAFLHLSVLDAQGREEKLDFDGLPVEQHKVLARLAEHGSRRLEQERLSGKWIQSAVRDWLGRTQPVYD